MENSQNMYNELRTIIEQAWENRDLLHDENVRQAVRQVIEHIDKGELRTAEPVAPDSASSLNFTSRTTPDRDLFVTIPSTVVDP